MTPCIHPKQFVLIRAYESLWCVSCLLVNKKLVKGSPFIMWLIIVCTLNYTFKNTRAKFPSAKCQKMLLSEMWTVFSAHIHFSTVICN